MKKKLLIGAMLMGAFFTANAQTTLFEDDFESHDDFIITGIGDWITIDVDGSDTYTGGGGIGWTNAGTPQAFIIFNPAVAEVENSTEDELRNFDPHSGAKYAASWAAVMPGQGANGPNDDWLISPEVTLGESGNEVTFWVKSMSSSYGLEEYEVGVYDGDGDPVDGSGFTMITDVETAPFPEWEQITLDLDDYAGDTVRIGIHCVSEDHYMFMVDDFMVTTDAPASVNDVLASKFSVYPNPANNVINLTNAENILVDGVVISDLNGRTVKNISFDGVASAQINVGDLSAGMYMMTVSSDKGTMTKKIVKN